MNKDKWYYSYITALSSKNIIQGIKTGYFHPNQKLARAEAAKIISLAFNLKMNSSTKLSFKDVHKTDWSYEYIQSLANLGLSRGKSKDQFAPNVQVTRGEFSAFVYRAEQAATFLIKNIEALSKDSVTISGNTYKVADNLKGLFNSENKDAILGGNIRFESKNGVIYKVTYIELTNAKGMVSVKLDGSGAVNDGSVKVSGDHYELKYLTIKGNLEITDKVQTSFTTDHITAQGQTIASGNEKVKTATFQTAEEKVKVTIVFKDSTMATIEIKQSDIQENALGTTSITELSIQSNANIFADENIILPKVSIKNGVTNVELSVSVKDVIIESTSDINISGKGIIDNLVVQSDKKVNLNTVGEIIKIESKKC